MNQAEARTLSQMEEAIGRVLTHEEALQFPAYRMGMALHEVVTRFWNTSAVITAFNTDPTTGELRNPLLRPAPYGTNSANGDGTWNFSWKAPEDELFNEPNDRASMLYTVYPNGRVICREFADDELNISNLLGMLNLAVEIVSDCLEVPVERLDAQATADKVVEQLLEERKQMAEARK